LLIFREQVVEGLIAPRTDIFRNGVHPFLGIVELGIHVENHTAEWENAMLDQLPEAEFRDARFHIDEDAPQTVILS